MSFPLNKRVNGVKVQNRKYKGGELGFEVVDVIRQSTDKHSLRIQIAESDGSKRVSTSRLLLQLKFDEEQFLYLPVSKNGCFRYVVFVNVAHKDFGKVGRIVGGCGRMIEVRLLSDDAFVRVSNKDLRYIRNPKRLFDHNPFTGEISDDYVVEDWVGDRKPVEDDAKELKPDVLACIGEDAITYKIQYVTSDGKVFGSTWEVNQYVDEQNKQRLHQKKMELLKTMAKEAGLEFEVNGSSIVLK